MNKWQAEKKLYEKVFLLITGRPTHVKDATGGELGYTSSQGDIYVAEKPSVMEAKDGEEKTSFFRRGVFTHEMLHQLFTPFDYFERVINTLPSCERQIFGTIMNVLEDPAIEYFAPVKVGGTFLKSLLYTIRKIYHTSPPVETSETAFGQYVSALIHFGDLGLIKGSFTFPEAKEIFNKTAPLFYKGIREKDGKVRVDIAKEIFRISEPLWRAEADIQKVLEELASLLAQNAISAMRGDGEGGNPSFSPADDDVGDAIKAFIESLSEDEARKEADGSAGEDGTDDKEKPEKPEKSKHKSVQSTESETEDEDADRAEKPEHPPTTEKAHAETEDGTPCDSPAPGEGYLDWEERFFEDNSSVLDDIKEDVIETSKEAEKEARAEAGDTSPLDECKNITQKGGSCLNERALVGKPEIYSEKLSELEKTIRVIVRAIQRHATDKSEDKERGKKGRLNLPRTQTGRVTTRLFDRRQEGEKLTDFAVAIAVDESGSMNGSRIRAAKDTAIILAEVFAKLDIPVYIMGFTADTRCYDTIHTHYITWNNKKGDRERLINLEAKANNRDGVSIRYLAEILCKKPAERKLLVIISDGYPAANNYENGRADTANAVREAKKKVSVLGVAVGNASTDAIKSFYGNDFLHISDAKDLATLLPQRIAKIFKSWGV